MCACIVSKFHRKAVQRGIGGIQTVIEGKKTGLRHGQPAGRIEFRYAVVFEGHNMKRLLVELCDSLAFDKSACRGC